MSNATLPFDLRTLVDLEAWQNPRFKDELMRDANAAVAGLATRYGFDISGAMEFRAVADSDSVYHLVVSTNPVGASPADAGSEVQAYMSQFQGVGSLVGGPAVQAGKASSTGVLGLCNTHICSVTTTKCQISS